MIKKIIFAVLFMILSVSLINSQTAWGHLPSQGSGSSVAPSAYIDFENIDSVNTTYSAWTPELSYFTGAPTGKTNYIAVHFNAGANDSVYVQVETRIGGSDSLIARCFSVLAVGSADPTVVYTAFADTAVGDEYRLAIVPIKNGQGAYNSRNTDVRVGFATDMMMPMPPKETWNGYSR